jgi:SAM-dependent methyltransferase
VEADPGAKLRAVRSVLERLQPATVVDLGANTGECSTIAARLGARVIAVDDSEACLERLYRAARADRLTLTPVIADVLCPTPGGGFMAEQYAPLLARIEADAVLCLGLMHHLHIAGRQPFRRLASLLRRLARRFLVFEFIDRADANIGRIESVRTIDYTFETVRDALASEFGPCEVLASDRASRKLLVFGRV